jgi:hypothetical protein
VRRTLVALALGAAATAGAQTREPTPSPSPAPPPFDAVTRITNADLRATPRPDNVWAVLRDVPGVVVDRVDVGGSETAEQSLLVSHGDPSSGATWSLDGIDVTDPVALGFSSLFPDVDSLAAIEARTSAIDVRASHRRRPGRSRAAAGR